MSPTPNPPPGSTVAVSRIRVLIVQSFGVASAMDTNASAFIVCCDASDAADNVVASATAPESAPGRPVQLGSGKCLDAGPVVLEMLNRVLPASRVQTPSTCDSLASAGSASNIGMAGKSVRNGTMFPPAKAVRRLHRAANGREIVLSGDNA